MHQGLPDSVESISKNYTCTTSEPYYIALWMLWLSRFLFVIVFQLTVLYLLYLAFILFVPFSFLKMCGGALTLSRSHLSDIDVA